MRRIRIALVVAVIGLSVVGALPAGAAGTSSVTVWTWNVAGWTMHRGSTTDGLVGQITSSVTNRGADLVALNELCQGQYDAVVSSLRAAGWPRDASNFARFEAHSTTACGGKPFGLAIFSKEPLGGANRYTLSSDGSTEARKLLCAPLQSSPHLRFCTTHITPLNQDLGGEKINVIQLTEVRNRVEAFDAAGDTVLVAGDFNAQPSYGRLDAWYSPTVDTAVNSHNTGAYRELDDTDARCPGYGEATTESAPGIESCGQTSKIDLIFVRATRVVGSYSADSLAIPPCGSAPCSDHRVLYGSVQVSVTPGG
ncbi:endonuclease/exonuclease/phosphatase family protein [Phycicoccus sp. HDW14]|nr:endonuclease/exonuclease/phosphatase family protein [Phycicoccus sp. HDW14]